MPYPSRGVVCLQTGAGVSMDQSVGASTVIADHFGAGISLRRMLLLGLLCLVAGATVAALLAARHPVAQFPSQAEPLSQSAGNSWAQVPPLAQLAISRALGKDSSSYWARHSGSENRARSAGGFMKVKQGTSIRWLGPSTRGRCPRRLGTEAHRGGIAMAS